MSEKIEESGVRMQSSAPDSNYVLGVDLGTTNSALTYWHPAHGFSVLEIEQLSAPGRVVANQTLPSFLYIPHTGEFANAAETALPWGTELQGEAVVGQFARERGAQVPERLVASAKSWLGHAQADRYSPILPWRSEITAGKLSPIAASSRYLSHLINAFEHDRRKNGETVDAAKCHVVLTVPASFDEVARNLTYEAARLAGLPHPVLLEEPLAAFYAWLALGEKTWRDQIRPGDLVLVCDVGGGTTDFSLIAVTENADGRLGLERVAVGDHLLLGGDNMDLALAHQLKIECEKDGPKLDHWQFLSLVASARSAKERLLSEAALDEVPVTVTSRGANLFATTRTTKLSREKVIQILIDGFFPRTTIDELPRGRRSVGIQEFGLAYETDPGVSRHLARFLKRAYQNVSASKALSELVAEHLKSDRQNLLPTAVLFNGGVFKALALRQRVMEILKSWNGGADLKELGRQGDSDLELAVARGAAYYGKLRSTGSGVRVRSGTARSYYVGLESQMPAVPGIEPPIKGLCLVPQGTDEGTELELGSDQFGLVVGEPVEFRFFSSPVRSGDDVGTIVEDAASELEESARLSVTLPSEGRREGEVVPVRLDAFVTAVGTLQLYMRDVATDQKWNLEFNVRAHEPN